MANGEGKDDRLPSGGWSASISSVDKEEVARVREASTAEASVPEFDQETEAFLVEPGRALDDEVGTIEFDLNLDSGVPVPPPPAPGAPTESQFTGDHPLVSTMSTGVVPASDSTVGDEEESDELVDALGSDDDVWEPRAGAGESVPVGAPASDDAARERDVASTESEIAVRAEQVANRQDQPTLDGVEFYASSSLPAISAEEGGESEEESGSEFDESELTPAREVSAEARAMSASGSRSESGSVSRSESGSVSRSESASASISSPGEAAESTPGFVDDDDSDIPIEDSGQFDATAESGEAAAVDGIEDEQGAEADVPFETPERGRTNSEDSSQYFSAVYEAAAEEPRLVSDVELPSGETRRSVQTPFGVESLPPQITVPTVEGGLPEGEFHWANQFDLFRDEALKLARAKRWRRLAATTAHACVHAPYSRGGTRTAMLLDLARIYRDRLKDSDLAEEAFRAAAVGEPENAEAISFLSERFEDRGDFRAMYELYHQAVESTWDPDDRLAWTRNASRIANERLRDLTLSTAAWEQLWSLGDAGEETGRELTRAYRLAKNWRALATFLASSIEDVSGSSRTVLMRELAELELSGNADPARAAEILREIGTENPEDPLVIPQLARIHSSTENWDALEHLGTESLSRLSTDDLAERRHLVAGVLWDAGRLAQAASIYVALLENDADDALARSRYHEHLRAAEEYDTLYTSLLGRAEAEKDSQERASLLSEAAEVAETHLDAKSEAISLLERRVELVGDDTDALARLAGLYDAVEDDEGLLRALTGLRALEEEPEQRLGVLRRLAVHTTATEGGEETAEECWTEILELDPNDMDAREQLMLLHRGRGDFEALDHSLMRQIALTQSDAHALGLSRLAAENLDQNFDDAARSIDAWRRVLDYAPGDVDALRALSAHFHAADDAAQEIGVLETRILVTEDVAERTELSLQVAALWAASGEPSAAAAAFERVLHWDHHNGAALEGLVGVYIESERKDLALAALDQAVGESETTEGRVALLRRTLELVDEDDHAQRFSRLRRIHLLDRTDDAVVEQLATTAAAGELWPAMRAVLEGLTAELPEGDERTLRRAELAGLLTEHLERPDRTYALLQAALLSSTADDEAIEELGELASSTGRDEDHLALLGNRTGSEFEADSRRAMVRARASLLETQIADPKRAFWELRRLIELDSANWDPLEDLGRMAAEHDLWSQLVEVLVELGDTASDVAERFDLASQIEQIAREKLEDSDLAFRMVVRRFRMAREDEDVYAALLEGADSAERWSWVLPVIEAARLADLSTGNTAEVAEVAELYAEHTGELERAFGMFRLAFGADPDSETLPNELSGLLEETSRYADYAASLRQAAATTGDEDRAVDLLRRTAAVYEDHLDRPEDAVDVHRRLLELRDDELPSLEVMIRTHRDREQWHDLRARLERSIEIGEDEALKVERLVEVAEVSETQLDDPHYALEVYGKVLELDADHEVARARIDGIVQRLDDAKLRLAFLRVELARSPEDECAGIELAIADLQLTRLEDSAGAVETLEALVERAGVLSDGFGPLTELLQATGKRRRRILLFLELADAQEEASDKLDTLRLALDESVRCDDLSDEERERILRSLLDIEPDDVVLHRQYAQLLRTAERFEALCDLLGETAEKVEDDVERLEVQKERARLLFANLNRAPEAVEIWEAILEADPSDEATLLALAMASLRAGNIEDYVARRREHARALPTEEAALVLCHLAEVADENELGANKVADFYREARRTNSACETAKLALKGIGRRKKQLRPEAALLPIEGEASMPWFERAERLRALGEESIDTDLGKATDWLQRAVATNPNDVKSWDALAAVYERGGESELAYRARSLALEAVRRNAPLSVETVDDEAGRLLAIAEASQAVGHADEYERIIRRVHSIAPTHGPTAVAVSKLMIASGEPADAFYLLDSLLARHHEKIPAELIADVYYARGCTRRDSGSPDAAALDFEAALKERPLYPEALREYASIKANAGEPRTAIEHLIRALVVEEEPMRRAELLHELGGFWEDGLGQLDEAGACYEMARAEGLATRELMLRVFKHFQRTGQLQQGLDVVDTLLESATEPDELATLWLARGEIYAEHEGREEDAVEAFDMALSYDPDLNEARAALASVLERREDWDQLLQILEAIAESDAGSAEQRANAFLRMARIAVSQLDDLGRAEEYLQASMDADKNVEAMTMLADLMADTSPGSLEHRALLGELAAMGPPWFKHCVSLGGTALGSEDRYAWCLLSPALMVRSSDDQLKAQLRDMRREYERPPLLVPDAAHLDELWETGMGGLRQVLAEVDASQGLGRGELDSLGGEVTDVSVHSNIGRTFAQFASHRGLDGCTLHRIAEHERPVVIVSREDGAPSVVIRADVFQQLARAEIGFILAYGTELARPGNRVFARGANAAQMDAMDGIWDAVGFRDATSRNGGTLAEAIRGEVSEETLSEWADLLEPLADMEPEEVAAAFYANLESRSLQLGLIAGADLFQAVRLLVRMEGNQERPGVFDTDDALDECLAQSEALARLVRFAASDTFARLLLSAYEV